MNTVTALTSTLDRYLDAFQHIQPAEWDEKPRPDKWSKKELLGHLVDSAQNNLRRFIVTQYKQNDTIVYHQDEWVAYQGYQEIDTDDVIALWKLLNRQIIRTINNIPHDKLAFTCDTGKNGPDLHSLQFLIDDYLDHLIYHLKQIVP